MLSAALANQVGQKRGSQQEEADTFRSREFLMMNPTCFTGSSTIEDLENFIAQLKRVFAVMHVVDAESVKLDTYQLKDISRILFEKWKKDRDDEAPPASWECFEEAFLGRLFS